MTEERILLIRTGGTIDSEVYGKGYTLRNPPDPVTALKGEDSLIRRTLETIRGHDHVDIFDWIRWAKTSFPGDPEKVEDTYVKDSGKFEPQEIHELAQIIKNDPDHRCFVITHGTSFMAKNAALLQQELKGSGKVVAFTGAMVPLSMQSQYHSDAIPALEFTLAHIRGQEEGVYVVGAIGRKAQSKRLAFCDPRLVEKDWDESFAQMQFSLKPRSR